MFTRRNQGQRNLDFISIYFLLFPSQYLQFQSFSTNTQQRANDTNYEERIKFPIRNKKERKNSRKFFWRYYAAAATIIIIRWFERKRNNGPWKRPIIKNKFYKDNLPDKKKNHQKEKFGPVSLLVRPSELDPVFLFLFNYDWLIDWIKK